MASKRLPDNSFNDFTTLTSIWLASVIGRKPRESWSNWELPPGTIKKIRKEFRRNRRISRLAYIPLVLAITYGFYVSTISRKLACNDNNETRNVLVTTINRSIQGREQLYRNRLISPQQYESEVKQLHELSKNLQPINCDKQAVNPIHL